MNRVSLFLTLAFLLILMGFTLVVAGSTMSGTAGGCFFWPFPVIIACGTGSGGNLYALIIVGLVAVVLMSFLSFIWMRRTTGE